VGKVGLIASAMTSATPLKCDSHLGFVIYVCINRYMYSGTWTVAAKLFWPGRGQTHMFRYRDRDNTKLRSKKRRVGGCLVEINFQFLN